MIRALVAAAVVTASPPFGFVDRIAPELPEFALEELERFVALHPGDRRAPEAHARLVTLAVRLGDYPRAERHLEAAEAAAPHWRWRLYRAELRALSGRTTDAMHGLWQLRREPEATLAAWQRILWVALRARWWGQALEAAGAIAKLAPEHEARLAPMVAELRAHLASPQPSAEQARWMSTFLPGSGQLYAGAWQDGAASLALNAGLATLLAGAVRSQDWVGTGLVVAFGSRYYLGGIENAGVRVEERNARIERALASRWLAAHEAWLLEGSLARP